MNQGVSPFIELIILSGFLIVLAFFVLYFFKKTKIGFNVKNTVRELDRFYYSPKSFISIIKVGEEMMLIGVTENNINLLKKIEDKETIDTLFLNYQKNNAGKNFSDFFSGENLNIQSIKSRLKQMRNNKDEEV